MDSDEIRAEIERRKNRARDLKLRESVWDLYNNLKYSADWLKTDPELIYPEIRESLEICSTNIKFQILDARYRLTYADREREQECWDRDADRTIVTDITVALDVNEAQIFEFKMQTTMTLAKWEPIFNEYMGEITGFIDGPWVTEIPELLQKIRLHQKTVRETRNAPKELQKLREDMKKFGL